MSFMDYWKKFTNTEDEDDFEEFNELQIDVNDYYEYLTYRRLLLDFCPIY